MRRAADRQKFRQRLHQRQNDCLNDRHLPSLGSSLGAPISRSAVFLRFCRQLPTAHSARAFCAFRMRPAARDNNFSALLPYGSRAVPRTQSQPRLWLRFPAAPSSLLETTDALRFRAAIPFPRRAAGATPLRPASRCALVADSPRSTESPQFCRRQSPLDTPPLPARENSAAWLSNRRSAAESTPDPVCTTPRNH